MATIRNPDELRVYRLGNELERRVAKILERPAVRADPDIFDQLKRASESVCENIAEGFDRFYARENARFVRVSRGSVGEIIVLLRRAARKRYITPTETADLLRLAKRVRNSTTAYIAYLQSEKAQHAAKL